MGKAKKLKLSQAPRNTPLREQIKKVSHRNFSSWKEEPKIECLLIVFRYMSFPKQTI